MHLTFHERTLQFLFGWHIVKLCQEMPSTMDYHKDRTIFSRGAPKK
jgi:hypothetical protein